MERWLKVKKNCNPFTIVAHFPLHCKEKVRSYNNDNAFASFAHTLRPLPGRGPKTFNVHGQTYHQTSDLEATPGSTPLYSQLYILDSGIATQERMNIHTNVGCNESIMKEVDSVTWNVSPYYQAYKNMIDVEREASRTARAEGSVVPRVRVFTGDDRWRDARRYNAPTTSNEIAIFCTGAEGEPPDKTFVTVHRRG